jgi:hypothetical protein
LFSGTFSEIKRKLLTASAIIKWRKAIGFDLFEPDETWRYVSEDDDRVCPICFGFDQDEFFVGDDIPAWFPMKERKPGEGLVVIHPHVHWDPTYSYLLGECRCRIFMLDIVNTLTKRLSQELRDVESA